MVSVEITFRRDGDKLIIDTGSHDVILIIEKGDDGFIMTVVGDKVSSPSTLPHTMHLMHEQVARQAYGTPTPAVLNEVNLLA